MEEVSSNPCVNRCIQQNGSLRLSTYRVTPGKPERKSYGKSNRLCEVNGMPQNRRVRRERTPEWQQIQLHTQPQEHQGAVASRLPLSALLSTVLGRSPSNFTNSF